MFRCLFCTFRRESAPQELAKTFRCLYLAGLLNLEISAESIVENSE